MVEFTLAIQDTSEFDDFTSGVQHVTYTLRNPLGEEFHFDAWEELGGANFYYQVYLPDGANDWQTVTLSTFLLPVGSVHLGRVGHRHPGPSPQCEALQLAEYVQLVLTDAASSSPTWMAMDKWVRPDLLSILAEFGRLSGCGTADIDGNDQVDVNDALVFLADYGNPCD